VRWTTKYGPNILRTGSVSWITGWST